MKQIGHVEILKTRVYNLDAECHCPSGSTVVVEPGQYPLYSDGLTTYWLMRARLNQQGLWRMGDGMFAAHAGDNPSAIEVVFPSKRFGPDEWAALLTDDTFAEGNPQQRVRVTFDSGEATAQ